MTEKKAQILFVDDEPHILETLGRMLSQCGEDWQGEFCSGVDDALDLLKKGAFDTVVSDIRMPGKNGFDLLEAIINDPRLSRIPVIILTGEGDRSYKRKVVNMGATDLLNKPVSRDDLIARIRSALRLKRNEDKLHDQVHLLDGLVRERTKELELSHREVLWRLAKAGDFRDDHTGDHVARVAACSCILAERFGMPQDFTELLFQTSPLHDIGKIGIPDAILLKPGKLSPEERLVMETHARIGEEILRNTPKAAALARHVAVDLQLPPENRLPSPLIQMAGAIALHHHEKWNGSGYPDRLVGERIPVEARIVAITDVFDALSSERPYKKAMPAEKACALIEAAKGQHFDPALVEVFISAFDEICAIYSNEDSGLSEAS